MTNTSNTEIYRVEKNETGEDLAVVRFEKTGNRGETELILPLDEFSDTKKLRSKLLRHGFLNDELNTVALHENLPMEAGLYTHKPGWFEYQGEVKFLLFKRHLNLKNGCIAVLDEEFREYGLGKREGDFESWQKDVAIPVGRSYVAMTAMLASLASPLLGLAKFSENPILNLAGTSSTGKTTANTAALSVWGNPADRPSWNSSPTRLLELGALHNNLPLTLDDLELADLKQKSRLDKLQEMTHLLSGGHSKDYSKSVKADLRKVRFQSVVLCSSPTSIEADQAQKQGRENSDRVRVLELMIPNGERGGIWADGPNPNGNETAKLSSNLRSAAEQNYGHAGQKWVAYLERRYHDLPQEIDRLIDKFVSNSGVEQSSLNSRIARKVGLFYAAGILASEAEVLPWRRTQINQCCKWALNNIMATAFPERECARSLASGLHQLFSSDAEVTHLKTAADAKTLRLEECQAFVDLSAKTGYIRPDNFKALFDPSNFFSAMVTLKNPIVQILITKGALVPGPKELTHTVRLNGAKPRFIKFDLVVLKNLARPVRPKNKTARCRGTNKKLRRKTTVCRRRSSPQNR